MKTMKAFTVVSILLLAACDSDKSISPTSPVVSSVAGTWSANWLVQFLRFHDNHTGSFNCSGSLTLTQVGGSGSPTLGGFAVVGGSCPPLSFDVTGSLQPDGTVTLTTGGPRPPTGQCPAPPVDTVYKGLMQSGSLSARGSTNPNCPGPNEGQHRFEYILTATKRS